MAGASRAPSQAGVTPNRQKRKAAPAAAAAAAASSTAASAGEADEEEIEELEREVSDLGRRILERRRDAATRLLEAAVSRFAALRPSPACLEAATEPQSAAGTSHAEAEKLKILKSKTQANIATIPKVLKKVNECVARMEKLEQLNVNIHPVFQRKR